MSHSITKALRLLLAVTVVASLYVACGDGHKCAATSECATGEKCQTNATTKLRECVKETVTTCDPACSATQECKEGTCVDKTPTGCTADSECASDEECKNSKCEKKTVTPDCTADTDCTGTNEECKEGKCVPKTVTPDCTADTDCTGTNEECKEGKCVPKTVTGCTDDTTCSGATPKCNVATTQCVACITDSDCTGGAACADNKCGTTNPGCTSDADCNNGETCDTSVTPGVCKPPVGTADVGAACSATAGCLAGLDCIATAANGMDQVCFQPCAADADCASNPFRNTCVSAGTKADGTALTLCLRRSKKGEACGFKSTKKEQGLCEAGATPPLYCDSTKGTCEDVILQAAEGDACTKSGVTEEPPKICDSSKGIACDEATGTCKQAKIAKEGEECDTDGANNAGEKILCDTGLTCIGFDQARTLQRCHKTCDASGAGAECTVAGTKCEPLLTGGGGLCFDTTCTTDAECAYADYRCADAQSGGKICLPKAAVGPVMFGGICKTPTKQFGCDTNADPDAFCLQADAMATQGYCTHNCTQDNTCPDWTDGTATIPSTCVEINPTTMAKACLFVCGNPGQSCPTGLTCQTVGAQQVCLAP